MFKFLVIGYYGMGNLGSEIRLKMIVADILKCYPDSSIRVATVGVYPEERIRHVRYIDLHGASIFNPLKILRHIRWCDFLVCGEGIPFEDFAGSGFLAYFLPSLYLAQAFKKRTILHTFDIDKLTRLENWLVKEVLERTDLLIARTKETGDIIKRYYLHKPHFITADPALLYQIKEVPAEHKRTKVGLVMKDFYCYPIKPKLIGRKEDLFKYPYYYTRHKENTRNLKASAERYIDNLRLGHGAEVFLIVLDHYMDLKFTKKIYQGLKDKSNVHVVSFDDHNEDDIISLIGSLDLMVSSRLHGLIFALRSAVPMIGLESDERFQYFFDYISLPNYCVDFRKGPDFQEVEMLTKEILLDSTSVKRCITLASRHLKGLARKNLDILEEYLTKFEQHL